MINHIFIIFEEFLTILNIEAFLKEFLEDLAFRIYFFIIELMDFILSCFHLRILKIKEYKN